MRPSPQKPYSGIFVINQFNKLKEDKNLRVELFSMERTFTKVIGSYLKYIKAFFSFVPLFFRKFDIIHLHYFFPFIALAYIYKLLRPSTRLIVTFHGSDINVRVNERNVSALRYFTKKIDFVISVGTDLSQMIFEKLSLNTDIILSAGVDDEVFKVLPDKEKLYHFTFASSFVSRKGIDIYLEAIRLMDRKDLKYCFIGSGELESEVRNMAKYLNITIKLNLKQSEMAEIFNQSYYHVLPSRFEPFGLVVTESMFCGVPSIVSNIGGIKDQVKDENNGFILNQNSSEALRNQMERCLNYIDETKYASLKKECLKSNKEHALSTIINQTKGIYYKLFSEIA